jgi:hypothetical protein
MLLSILRVTKRPIAFALWLGVVTMVWPQLTRSQAIRSAEEIQRIVTIERLSVHRRIYGGYSAN